jgi:hypothetical protein
MGPLFPFASDAVSTIDSFLTGQYVAETTLQKSLRDNLTMVEETLKPYLEERLTPA